MELKIKYQYSYFIKPFLINKKKYKQYLFSLLNNKNYSLKIFQKEKDLNVYSYFINNIRDYYFSTFSFNKERKAQYDKLDNKLKSVVLSNYYSNIFEYNVSKKIQGKIDKENGIFFNIENTEIICFDTGICFLVIKTSMENTNNFDDLLNFNYKFKNINSSLLEQ